MSTERAPDLKRCPCCGGAAVWSNRTVTTLLFATRTRSDEWQALCGDNGCVKTPWGDSRDFTAERWNRRPSPAPGLEEAVEAKPPTLREAVELFADAADYNLTCWDAYGDGPTPAGVQELYELGRRARALLTTRGDEREGVATPSASHRGCSVTKEDGNE